MSKEENCIEKMVIRKMEANDILILSELENRVFSVPWSKNMLFEELENENAIYLVATLDLKIVGYAGAWKIFDEGHITNVAVDPVFQRKGIGKILLSALLESLTINSITKATLEVRRGNVPAIKLYQLFGFQIEGIRKGYYSDNHEDALIMWLNMLDTNRYLPDS